MKDGVGKIEFAWTKRWKERKITLNFKVSVRVPTLRYLTVLKVPFIPPHGTHTGIRRALDGY